MFKLLGINKLFVWIVRQILKPLVKTTVQPEDLSRLDIDWQKPVCYVLKNESLAELLTLEHICKESGLPLPTSALDGPGLEDEKAICFLTHTPSLFTSVPENSLPASLCSLFHSVRSSNDVDIQLIPVSIFWGKLPERENSLLKILFSDSWNIPGKFKKTLIILIQGRQTLVHFDKPFSVRQVINEGQDEERSIRKITRVLRVHFRMQKETIIGPDLSHRRTVMQTLLHTQPVINAICEDSRARGIPIEKSRKQAQKFAAEIAADYSHSVILTLNVLLTWFWNKLYDGVETYHIDNLQSVAKNHEVIYVPCHRSHIDYLLLSYVLYHGNLVPPHIAAGVNLNLPVIGSILRRSGAFFIRRSFRDNPLYGVVFKEYLGIICRKGFSVEYFIEGGRSRTGRLLPPRPGMLAMTVRAFLRDRNRNFLFVPIYIGYERLLEGDTYLGELQGKAKKKESVFGIFKTLGRIRGSYGKVHLNFGKPILLDDVLNKNNPCWQDADYNDEDPPPWVKESIENLGTEINTRINKAAVANPVNLLALVMLATRNHSMDENSLRKQLDFYLKILLKVPYSDTMVVPDCSGTDIINHCKKLNIIESREHAFGTIVTLGSKHAILMTYFRNNTIHLLVLPSMLACILVNNPKTTLSEMKRICMMAYPLLQNELFLRWPMENIEQTIQRLIDVLEQEGLITANNDEIRAPKSSSIEYLRLTILSNTIRQTLERFYITIEILLKAGSGKIRLSELEDLCHLMAQRMSILHQINSPEFFDKTLFKTLLRSMLSSGTIWVDNNDRLSFGEDLITVDQLAASVINAEIRLSIKQVTNINIGLQEVAAKDDAKNQ